MLNNQDVKIIEEIVDRKTREVVHEVVEDVVEEVVDRVVEEKLDRKMSVFIEHANDQFQRIVEMIRVIDERTRQIPIVLRRMELADARLDANESDIQYHHKRLKRLEADNPITSK